LSACVQVRRMYGDETEMYFLHYNNNNNNSNNNDNNNTTTNNNNNRNNINTNEWEASLISRLKIEEKKIEITFVILYYNA